MPSPLAQHSLEAFTYYEPYIAAAIESYPTPIELYPPNSPRTFEARIRDAVQSIQLNHHSSDRVTLQNAQRVFRSLGHGGEFVFRLGPTANRSVICGPYAKQASLPPASINKPRGQDHPPETIDAGNQALFDAVLVLKAHGHISYPITFFNVTELHKILAAEYNYIEFFPSGNNEYTMI